MRLLQQLQFYCYHHCLVDAFFFLSSQRPRLSHLEEAWKEAALPTGGGAEGESAGPGRESAGPGHESPGSWWPLARAAVWAPCVLHSGLAACL